MSTHRHQGTHAWRTVGGALLQGQGADFGHNVLAHGHRDQTMLHVLRRQATERPNDTWLTIDGVHTMTFGEAWHQARQVAGRLGGAREGRDGSTHVALLLRNHLAFMPVFYGTMLAGGISLPLNPDLQGPLLASSLEMGDVDVLVTHAAMVERLHSIELPARLQLVITVDQCDDDHVGDLPVRSLAEWTAGSSPVDASLPLPGPEATAAILFTSGTTGGSKGVVCSHRYLYLFSGCVSDTLGHHVGDVLTTPLQMCHVAALGVIANSALHVGCSAHLKSSFSASRFWADAARDRATFCMLIGQMAEMILKSSLPVSGHRLDHIYLVPRPPHQEEFEERFGTTLIWQGSGLTEAFPHPPSKAKIEDVPPSNVGHALAWYEYGVVDEHDRLVSPGVEGELVYRSRVPFGMFSGYYKDSDRTSTALRNFMFHTGDLAFYDEEGRVNYLRRMADTVRRAGENVSCTELEGIVLLHPDVLAVAAYGVPDDVLGEEIKLDVVVRGTTDMASLHKWMARQLPRYMLPGLLEQRATLPMTPSQKVEKHRLKAEGVDRPSVVRFGRLRR